MPLTSSSALRDGVSHFDVAMQNQACALDCQSQLGECPVWDAREQALYWVDIIQPALHRWDYASGARRSWPMPLAIGSFGLSETQNIVAALSDGFYRFNLDTGALKTVACPDDVAGGCRFNDGKVSPDGRFFAGTMDEAELRRPLGALYRLDPDGCCKRVAGGVIVSNGLAWTADGATMFHSDSKGKAIYAWDYDLSSGHIGNRRLVAQPGEDVGRPDGGAFDVEGYYWSAGISAGVLNRWSPDGRLDRQIPMPCAAPTCPCFGGPDLKTIFVTSLRHGLSPEKLAQAPLSGGLFAVHVDVPGVPVARFAG